MRNATVKTYTQGERYYFKIFLSAEPNIGALGHLYDSKTEHPIGFASEEKARQAGLNKIRNLLFQILDQFIQKWANGCTAKEWQASLPSDVPVVVWDAFFHYVLQCGYVREEGHVYELTQEGQNVRTQLKEICVS